MFKPGTIEVDVHPDGKIVRGHDQEAAGRWLLSFQHQKVAAKDMCIKMFKGRTGSPGMAVSVMWVDDFNLGRCARTA